MQKISQERALIVVDPQLDFCPGGALGVPGGDEIIPIINRLGNRYNCVVITQDWHPAGHFSFASTHGREPFSLLKNGPNEQILWPDHCIQGSEGATFHPDLDLSHARLIVRKGHRPNLDSYSAFVENDRRTRTGLDGYLRSVGIKSIDLCGLAFDFCVGWSAIDALNFYFPVRVLSDVTRAVDTNGSLEDINKRLQEYEVPLISSTEVLW